MDGKSDKNGKIPTTDEKTLPTTDEKTLPTTDDKTLEGINYACNFFGIRLPFLQQLGNVAGFTAFYSVGALCTQTLAAYIGSQIPTLEKQFGLSSYESGIIMTFNDIGFLLCILLVSSIPRLVHVPRWLFGTMCLFAISGIICSLPHFIFPTKPFNHNLKDTGNVTDMSSSTKSTFELCSNKPLFNQTTQNQEKPSESQTIVTTTGASVKAISIALIGIGMSLQGVAKAPRAPFTTVYLDDGCDKRKTGFYLGIIIGSSIFGPALSYGLGGFFSRIYVTLEDVDMSPNDPRWIGAWWLGFVVFGALSLIVAIPMLCFPRYLAEKNSHNLKDKERIPSEKEVTLTRLEKVKERTLSYFRVLKSPVYVCVLCSTLLNWSSIIGKIVFLPKYIGAMFGVPLWKANIIVSAANLVTVSVGTIIGGTITRKFNMSPRRCFQFILFLFCIQTIFLGSELFIGCNQPEIIGPDRLDQTSVPLNGNCQCDQERYFPVCGSNGVTYHSPCYAGCFETLRNGRMFANCSVIPDGRASAGLCPFDCNMLSPYIAVNVIGSLCGALSIMPAVTAKLRTVEDRDKGTAIGLQSTLGSLLVALPVPILFGKIIDTTCLIWNAASNRKGSCALYNIKDLQFRMLGVAMLYRIAALFFVILSVKLVWNIKDWKDLWKGKPTKEIEEVVKLLPIKGSKDGDKVVSVV